MHHIVEFIEQFNPLKSFKVAISLNMREPMPFAKFVNGGYHIFYFVFCIGSCHNILILHKDKDFIPSAQSTVKKLHFGS